MHYWNDGPGFWSGGFGLFMTLMMLFWIALIGLAIWGVVRLARGSGQGHGASGPPPTAYRPPALPETPRQVLDRRLAAGEIDADEYVRLRTLLEGGGPGAARSGPEGPPVG